MPRHIQACTYICTCVSVLDCVTSCRFTGWIPTLSVKTSTWLDVERGYSRATSVAVKLNRSVWKASIKEVIPDRADPDMTSTSPETGLTREKMVTLIWGGRYRNKPVFWSLDLDPPEPPNNEHLTLKPPTYGARQCPHWMPHSNWEEERPNASYSTL